MRAELTVCTTLSIIAAGRLVNITGDVLLASGVVAYLGAFDARYRKAIISDWQKLCKEQKIACSNEFSLTNILGDQVRVGRVLCDAVSSPLQFSQ